MAGVGGSCHGHSSTCRSVSAAPDCFATDAANSTALIEQSEKSTPHSTDVNGLGALVRARGGTVSTGQVAFRSTFSVTEPSNRCWNPLVPCVPITMRSAGSESAIARMSGTGSPCRTATSTGVPASMIARHASVVFLRSASVSVSSHGAIGPPAGMSG